MTLSSGSRIKVIGVGALALVLAVADLGKDIRDYRQAGSLPSNLTFAQAREAAAVMPFVRRWVRLTEPLQLDCKQALQQTEDNKVQAIIILATDASKEQPFLLNYDGNVQSCEQLKSIPLEGMLIEPDVKVWTTHGMAVPSTRYPMIGLAVGHNPPGLLQEAKVLSGVILVALALLWFGYVSGPAKKTAIPVKTFAKAAR